MLYVLDSTVLIDYLRGRPAGEKIAAIKAAGDIAATTAINVEEIVRGLRPKEQNQAERLFAGLLQHPVDSQAAWRAGGWRREFAARGITLWQADCLIGAVTVQHRGTLLTANVKDFPMTELRIEQWPVGF